MWISQFLRAALLETFLDTKIQKLILRYLESDVVMTALRAGARVVYTFLVVPCEYALIGGLVVSFMFTGIAPKRCTTIARTREEQVARCARRPGRQPYGSHIV